MKNSKISTIAQIAVIAAVMCVLGPLTLPIGPVPISLTPFVIFLGVYILGMKKGTVAVIIYVLLGAFGIPVFSSFSGGIGKIMGPTGGYIIGYIFMALVAGFFIDKFYKNIPLQVIGMAIGLFVRCYGIGTVWLKYQMGITFAQALAVGVIPFIALDLVKMAIAIVLGRAVRYGLIRAGVMPNPVKNNKAKAA